MSHLVEEIASQPECWAKAIEMAASAGPALPARGEYRIVKIRAGQAWRVTSGQDVPQGVALYRPPWMLYNDRIGQY